MSNPIPGAIEEWTETATDVWERTDHPESGIITLTPPLTFEEYYAERQLPNQGEILKALPEVAELISLLAAQDGPAIDAWVADHQLREVVPALLKLLAARL
jgi:hypothetical protein